MKSENFAKVRETILSWPWPPFLKKLLIHWLSLSFLRYLVIGFSTFFIQVVLLYLFTNFLGIEKVAANIISTLLSCIFNFTMSNSWTFQSGNSAKGKKLAKYIAVVVFNYCFDTLFAFPLLAVTLQVNQYLAKVIITGMIVTWNFFIYKFWVFKDEK